MPVRRENPLTLNVVSYAVIAAGMKVHTAVGPGVRERAWHLCLLHELTQAGRQFKSQAKLLCA
jgi:GxxExxY protein